MARTGGLELNPLNPAEIGSQPSPPNQECNNLVEGKWEAAPHNPKRECKPPTGKLIFGVAEKGSQKEANHFRGPYLFGRMPVVFVVFAQPRVDSISHQSWVQVYLC